MFRREGRRKWIRWWRYGTSEDIAKIAIIAGIVKIFKFKTDTLPLMTLIELMFAD